MPVGVIDVGSNTVRLLVSERGQALLSNREMLGLGADIERHGGIPLEKLELTESVVRRFVAEARAVGAVVVEVLIASPGRQAANGVSLATRLERASGCPTRILTAVEEGHLAFVGALSCAGIADGRAVAVVDVGGGSAQIVGGSRREGPTWARSIDLGSQRLTSRLLSEDPPGAHAMIAARNEVDRYLVGLEPPAARAALAVGGSARALKRVAGGTIDAASLDHALALLATTPTAALARRYRIGEARARTLPAGAVIFAAIQELLGMPLEVQRGGLREGALLKLAA
ncbi:MAG TPA: hypothetical protein VFJ93_08580 [Gaiellaceae bacterium]|nr:hypothetical protein [Gaiellaceae bacterium]